MTTNVIEHNPMLKKPLLAVLAISAQQTDESRNTVERRALETWDDAYQQTPSACVDILVRNGALTERIIVNGAPYDGTLEDLQLDENVPNDATAESRLAITAEGRALLDAYAPERTLQTLLAGKPRYQDIFLAALAACTAESGASRADLERAIDAKPAPTDGAQRVYPQYFIDALETAGGIAWDGTWRITDAGRAVIAAARS